MARRYNARTCSVELVDRALVIGQSSPLGRAPVSVRRQWIHHLTQFLVGPRLLLRRVDRRQHSDYGLDCLLECGKGGSRLRLKVGHAEVVDAPTTLNRHQGRCDPGLHGMQLFGGERPTAVWTGLLLCALLFAYVVSPCGGLSDMADSISRGIVS